MQWLESRSRSCRYEDNFDAINCFAVTATPSDKGKISDYGTPEKFLESISYLLGKQSFSGETRSEGGFAPNRVSVASLLDVAAVTDKKGKEYYTYNILTRTGETSFKTSIICMICPQYSKTVCQ